MLVPLSEAVDIIVTVSRERQFHIVCRFDTSREISDGYTREDCVLGRIFNYIMICWENKKVPKPN